MVADILRYSMRMILAVVAGALLVSKGLPLLWTAAPVAGVTATASPAAAVPAPGASGTQVVLDGNGAGHFQANVLVNGATLRMLVDTGATAVALTAEDAQRAGIHVFPGDFRVPISTANGVLAAARVQIDAMSLGGIRMRGVSALVLPRGAARMSLLGMTFLRRLSGFEVADNHLILRP